MGYFWKIKKCEKEGSVLNITIPPANTHSDVAKEQHLVPRTYMRQWSYNNADSIYIFEKSKVDKGIHSANVDNINYLVGYHDIKAGDIFVPEEALSELFGFWASQCLVYFEGEELDSLRKLNDKFYEFDSWEIKDKEGVLATKKEKNEIKRTIMQSRYTFIETEWCYQYEDSWTEFITALEKKIRSNELKVLAKPVILSADELAKLMEYIIVFDFRSIGGNAWIKHIIDDILPEEIDLLDIPPKERIHSFNKTAGEEFRHASIIKAFYEYLKNKNGKIRLILDKYMANIGIRICLSDENMPFITSELPSQVVRNLDGQNEHIFVATPTMLITTYKTDNTNRYTVEYLKRKYVNRYNKYIAKNSNVIITKDDSVSIDKLLS